MPGLRPGSRPGRPAEPAPRVRAGDAPARPARPRTRSGSCPTDSRRPGSRSPAGAPRLRGPACRPAPRGASMPVRRQARCSRRRGPPLRAARSSPRSCGPPGRSVMPGRTDARRKANASSPRAQARPMAATSAALFRMRRSARAASTDSSVTSGAAKPAPPRLHGWSGCASRPRRWTPASASRAGSATCSGSLASTQLPGWRLGRGLLDVAVVGQDPGSVRGYEQGARVARGGLVAPTDGEAGQVAAQGAGLDQDRRPGPVPRGRIAGLPGVRDARRRTDPPDGSRRALRVHLGHVRLVLCEGHRESVGTVANAVRARGHEEEVAL